MRRPVSDGMRCTLPSYQRAQGTDKKGPAKKVSTAALKATKNFSQPKLTIGLNLGDRSSWYCLLDEVGDVLQEQKLSTTPKAMREMFGKMPHCRIALETGTNFPWLHTTPSQTRPNTQCYKLQPSLLLSHRERLFAGCLEALVEYQLHRSKNIASGA